MDQWGSELWLNESNFQIFGPSRHVFVRYKEDDQMVSTCMFPTVKHAGGGVMVRAALLVQHWGIQSK